METGVNDCRAKRRALKGSHNCDSLSILSASILSCPAKSSGSAVCCEGALCEMPPFWRIGCSHLHHRHGFRAHINIPSVYYFFKKSGVVVDFSIIRVDLIHGQSVTVQFSTSTVSLWSGKTECASGTHTKVFLAHLVLHCSSDCMSHSIVCNFSYQ